MYTYIYICIYVHIYNFPCLNVPQFILPPTEGYLGCFHILAIMNPAVINIHVQVFVQTCFQLLWVNAKDHTCWTTCYEYVGSCKKLPNCLSVWLYHL